MFEPRYSGQAVAGMEQGYAEVATLVAATDLGQFSDPSSYDKAADRYAGALGQIALARQSVSAAGQRQSSPAARAAALMRQQIDACADALTTMSAQHRRAGLTAGAGYGSVLTACAIPLDNMQN